MSFEVSFIHDIINNEIHLSLYINNLRVNTLFDQKEHHNYQVTSQNTTCVWSESDDVEHCG